jgi:hypothetical protein
LLGIGPKIALDSAAQQDVKALGPDPILLSLASGSKAEKLASGPKTFIIIKSINIKIFLFMLQRLLLLLLLI